MTAEQFDVAIIGGGPGGYVAGIRLGQHKKNVVVIESEHLGGVCLNWGCIPSKAIIHAANLKNEIAHFGKVFSQVPEVDVTELQAWKDKLIGRQRGGIASLLKANRCVHKVGMARITGPNSLEVRTQDAKTEVVQFKQLVIATGAGIIEIPGFSYSDPLIGYAKNAVAYDPVPKRLAIIGGGVIGCELGMAYAKLGAKVSIMEMTGSLLPGMDTDLVRPVLKNMKKLGIEILTNAKASAFKKNGAGAVVDVEQNSKMRGVDCDQVLVAVGFRPNTKGLGLDLAGVQLNERGWVTVDQECRTNVPHIFAIGDVTGPPLLAHRASHMGEVAADVIAGKPAAFDVMAMPLGVFTDPEVAFAGISEAEAEARGYDVRTGKFPLAALGRAGAMNVSEGLVKVIIDAKSDIILGVGVAAPNGCDLIAEVCLALEMGALSEDVALTVHVHPTLSEGIMEAAKAARGEAVHMINRRRERPSRPAASV